MKTKLLIGTAIVAVSALAWPAMAETLAGSHNTQLAQMDKGGGASSGGSPSAQSQGEAPEGSRKGDTPAAKSGEAGQTKNGPASKGAMEQKGGAEKSERAQDRTKGKDEMKRGDKDRDTKRSAKDGDRDTKRSDTDRDTKRGDKDKDRADRREGKDSKSSDRNRDDKNASAKNDSKGDGKPVQLDQSKQTRVKTVIRSQNVKHISRSDIKISIRVGTRVPQRIHWYPVPVAIFDEVPEYRGYYYIIVDDEIIIIEPRTREIVTIIAV